MPGISVSPRDNRFDNTRSMLIAATHLYVGKPGLEMPTEMPFDGFKLLGRPEGDSVEIQIDINREAIELGTLPPAGLRGQSGRIKLNLRHDKPIKAGPASVLLFDDEFNLWFFTPKCGIAGVWWSGERQQQINACEIELYPFLIGQKAHLLAYWQGGKND